LPAPYVGQGRAALDGDGFAAVVVGTEGGGDVVVVGRGRALPHETKAPVAAIAPIAAKVLVTACLSAEMTPEIGEEA
jgi:hypothetical protein